MELQVMLCCNTGRAEEARRPTKHLCTLTRPKLALKR